MSATISGRIRWAISNACAETVSRSPVASFGIDLMTRWLQPDGGPSPWSCVPASSWRSRAGGTGSGSPDTVVRLSLASRASKSPPLMPAASTSMDIAVSTTNERRVV